MEAEDEDIIPVTIPDHKQPSQNFIYYFSYPSAMNTKLCPPQSISQFHRLPLKQIGKANASKTVRNYRRCELFLLSIKVCTA